MFILSVFINMDNNDNSEHLLVWIYSQRTMLSTFVFHWFMQTRCLGHMVIGTHTCRATKIQSSSSCDDCTAFASIEPLNSQMMWKWNTKKKKHWNDFVNCTYSSMSYETTKKKKSHLSMSLKMHVSTVWLFFYKFKYSTLDFL